MRRPIIIRFVLSAMLLLGGISSALMLSILINSVNETAFAQHNLIRLHVLAHSNLPHDQDLKLMVRDAVLAEAKIILETAAAKKEAHNLLLKNKSKIQEAAQETVFAKGYDYPVEVHIDKYSFPAREYGPLSLPEGWYDAVRVEIGSAQGANWWCVLFPPLCLAELEGGESNLVEINTEDAKGFAFRSKFWQHFSQTRYARTLQRWWQASARSYSILLY